MCSKIGKLLKWTCKPLIYPTSKTFSKHPPNLCDSTISSGLNIVTSRIITLVGNSDNRRRYNTATYENVRDAGKANNVWIIDVRDRRDISRTGAIKNAINIPLKELEAAFQFTPEYFFNRYGASKPYFDSSIIFSCRSGRLSKVAYELAESMGYKNLKNFEGGYLLYEQLCANMVTIATFEEVKNIKPDVYLIDVRERNELEETGTIPHSINIPLVELAVTIGLDAAAFKSKFGRAKPTLDSKIILTCRSGARAEKAAIQLKELGYKNVAYYKGSWNEWSQKTGKGCSMENKRECD